MKTAVFLQARIASTRLPRKALLPLAGLPCIEHAMRSLRRVTADVHVLLTDAESVEELTPSARRSGFAVYSGPRDDVLSRYAEAARAYGVDRYFRATGDNPLVSWQLAEELHRLHEDYGSHFSGLLGPPLGTGVELVESAALYAADREAVDPYDREHVHPFIYRRPERFVVYRPWASEDVCFPAATVTLDTEEDYEFLSRLYGSLYDGEPIEPGALVAWLRENEYQEIPDDSVYSVYKTG